MEGDNKRNGKRCVPVNLANFFLSSATFFQLFFQSFSFRPVSN